MNYKSELLLTKYEKQIINILNKTGVLSLSDISKKINIPRTSLYSPIKKLEDRGLVTTEKSGRERKVILKKFKSVKKDRDVKNQTLNLGKSDYLSIIYEILKLEPGERVFWIQTSMSLKKTFNDLTVSEIINLNKKIVQSECIIDGILEDNYYQTYKSLVEKDDFIKAMESLLGRPYEIHLSNNLPVNQNEIIIFPHAVFIFDWKEKKGIWSESKVIIDLTKNYFNSLKESSKKVDISSLIRNLIEG